VKSKFIEAAKKAGVQSDNASIMFDAGVTLSLVEAWGKKGLSFKAICEVFFSYGATSILVLNSLLTKLK